MVQQRIYFRGLVAATVAFSCPPLGNCASQTCPLEHINSSWPMPHQNSKQPLPRIVLERTNHLQESSFTAPRLTVYTQFYARGCASVVERPWRVTALRAVAEFTWRMSLPRAGTMQFPTRL